MTCLVRALKGKRLLSRTDSSAGDSRQHQTRSLAQHRCPVRDHCIGEPFSSVRQRDWIREEQTGQHLCHLLLWLVPCPASPQQSWKAEPKIIGLPTCFLHCSLAPEHLSLSCFGPVGTVSRHGCHSRSRVCHVQVTKCLVQRLRTPRLSS